MTCDEFFIAKLRYQDLTKYNIDFDREYLLLAHDIYLLAPLQRRNQQSRPLRLVRSVWKVP